MTTSDFLLPGRVATPPHITTRQYARKVDGRVKDIDSDSRAYRTHSRRRTKPTLIYKKIQNLRALQLLSGYTKLESTVRYYAIEVDVVLEIAEKTEI